MRYSVRVQGFTLLYVVNEWLCSWSRLEITGTKASCLAGDDVIQEQDDGRLSDRVTSGREIQY